MAQAEQQFNELNEKYPLVDEEEKDSSPRPPPAKVRQIVAETAALLLQQAISSPWILTRLKQLLPTGVLHATVTQL